MSRRRVVVTGLGATTPIGGDVTTSWSALLAGTSGVRNLTEEWAQSLPVHFAARVAVEPAEQMERVELRRLDRSEQFALIASREAWKDAGSPEIDKERLGVVIASGIGGVTTLLDQYDILREKGARLVSPHTVPMLMPNGPAANVGLELQARAGVHTPVSACASGAEAIGYALEMIRNDRADIVVSGGVEAAIHAMPMSGFAAMKALSTRNDEPQRASRPYDLNRDGFVLGEGGGILVLEEYEHALARGAKIYCEIAGQGLTSDGYHIAAPDPDGVGVQRAVKFALRDSGLTTKDIVHLNAHATSTPAGDVAEAIGYALEMIRNDRADIVVGGGVEAAIHAMPMSGFAAMKALSTRNDEPARASRPYDLNRDGFVLGEGGGILVLEEYEHAVARGAKIYCEIAGQGLTSDGYHIAAPDPDGAGVQRAVKFALRDSGLTTKDIVHLNAHATSTPAGDVAEANALRAALGADADHVAVSATKSMTGHLLGGAGAIESVFIVKTLQDRLAPPTINIDDLDPAVTVDVVRDKPRALPAGDIAALNDSFGFGGHNVVLVFKSI